MVRVSLSGEVGLALVLLPIRICCCFIIFIVHLLNNKGSLTAHSELYCGPTGFWCLASDLDHKYEQCRLIVPVSKIIKIWIVWVYYEIKL